MTNKAYLTALLSGLNVAESQIDMVLTDAGLNASADASSRSCKIAVYNSFSRIIPLANVSEGDLSITWNMDAVKAFYRSLCDELGVEDRLSFNPRVKGVDVW